MVPGMSDTSLQRTIRSKSAVRGPDEIAALVERAAAGDERAWDDLVTEFGGLIWAVTRAHRLSHADAAEVAQITWTRLVEHVDRLQDPARVGAWLATTARRESLGIRRRGGRIALRGDDFPEYASEAPAHGTRLVEQERDDVLWKAFELLHPRDRELLRMLIADPRPSYEEISAALDMSIGSIGPTQARALEKLRREVERLGVTADELEGWR
jgi:RNA polymerase sigma factor (sigma-70 family)